MARTTDVFLKEAREKYGDRFIYGEFNGDRNPMEITDTETGVTFLASPNAHIKTDQGIPKQPGGCLARTCSLCGDTMITQSPDDLRGFHKHGEKHPDHFLGKPTRYEWLEKNYWNPETQEWFGSRKYLARSVKAMGWSNEKFYLTHGPDFMQEEWEQNENDEKYGNAKNCPTCLECGKTVKFNEGKWQYPVFCGESCSTRWHAKNTDRIERAQATLLERQALDPTLQLRPNQIDYWIVKHQMEPFQAEEMVRKRQSTFGYDAMERKYGKEKAVEIVARRNLRWHETKKKNGNYNGLSMVSGMLFQQLSLHIPRLRWGRNESPVRGASGKVYQVDCLSVERKKIIEFYGDYYHANPLKYSGEYLRMDMTAKDIWDKDARTVADLVEKGYSVLVVWEHDYRKNANETIQKCINFMKA